MGRLRVLMLEDNPEDAELLAMALHRNGIDCEWSRVDTRQAYLAELAERPDIVLADYSLPGFDAIEALTMLAETGLEIPVIVVTGVMSEEACVESLRHGAIDYLLKDRLTRLGPAVEHALDEQRLRVSRREAEQASQRLGAMLLAMVNNSPAAIYVKDRDGRYLVANRRLEEILGMSPGSATGRTDRELLPASVAQALATLDRDCIEDNRPDQREEEFGDDGDRRVYLSVRYPIRGDDEATDAVGGIYTEITAMKRIEGALRSARAELRNQAAHLEQDNLDLRELDRVKGEFIESVSHELRTPLAIINGTVELMLEGDFGHLTPHERSMVATVERAGRRLLATISDLLTVFQMDRGGFVLDLRPTQLADVIRTALNTIDPMLGPAQLRLSVDVPAALPLVLADGDQIGRVLLNLMTNAIKFSPPGAAIEVSARPGLSEVVVTVHDSGIGIPEAEQAQVFLRFSRGGMALRRATQGSGLGLAISREIVERHRGWIDLDSKEGEGTTVTFGLPRQTDEAIPNVPL